MATFFEWLKGTLGNGPKRESSSTLPRQDTYPRVYDSQLEDRRVLNAGAVVSAIDLVSLRLDAGRSANDGTADSFELTRLDSSHGTNQVAVSINNHTVWQGNAAELQSIRFDGSSDADQFYIDPTIKVPAGIFIDGTGIASASLPQGASDVVVFAASSGTSFDEITYQAADNHTQVRFVVNADALNSVIQVQNVESIRDLNLALERTLVSGASGALGAAYSLQAADEDDTTSVSKTVQWSSDQSHIDFTIPSKRLVIDLRGAATEQDSLRIDTVDLTGVEQLDILGDSTDAVQLQGELTVGRAVSIQAGTIRADGNISAASGGSIRLDSGSGELTVNGAVVSRGDDWHRGGDVVLAADRVLLQERARVDVSGGTGGGQIRVGGGYQGKDQSIRNSQYTYVSANAALNADARISGNGGKVVVWSDNTSIVDGSGNIVARGGIHGGDGGFIETSAKSYLRIDGAANAFSYLGEVGTWLVDPNDVEIVTTAGSAPLTTYILISTVTSALVTGNFTISTDVASAGNGDIRIVDALSLAPTASRTLTLNATRDIVFQSGLTGNSNLQVSLIAGRDVDSSSASIGQLGSLTIDAARNIDVNTINLSGGTFTATIDSNDDNLKAFFRSTGALSARSISISGSTTVNDDVKLGSTVTATTGAIQFTQVDDLTLQGDVTANTSITLTSVSGPITLGSNVDIITNNGTIDFSTVTSGLFLNGSNGSQNILFANGTNGNIALSNVSANNSDVSLALSSSNSITVDGIDIQSGTLTVTIDVDNNNNNATFQSTSALSAGSISVTGSATVNDDLIFGSTVSTSSGAIQISRIDDLSFQGDVTAATNITFSNVVGPLSLGSNVDITANNGPLNFTNISSGVLLDGSNGSTNLLKANGSAGSITIGGVTVTNSDVSLTLSSTNNTTVGSINIQNGTLTSSIDSNNNNVGATFQATGALTAGDINISGSATVNDNATISSTLTSTTGTIEFSNLDNLTLQGDVTAAKTVTFTNVLGPLSLGTGVDVTANNGSLNFTSLTSGVLLAGSNGSTTVLTANGSLGSLSMGSLTSTNSVSLTLSSTSNIIVGDIDIQDGTLNASIDSDDNDVGATLQSTGALTAGVINISGSPTVNDNATIGSTLNSTTGAIQFTNMNNLTLQGDVTAVTNTKFVNVLGQLSLGTGVDITANNGSLDFSTIASGILLTGTNSSTNILSANGTSGSLKLGSVSSTNLTVSLTLSSDTDTQVGSINIRNGTLTSTIDSNNSGGLKFQSTGALSAGVIRVTGSAIASDDATFGSTISATTGSIQFSRIDDLTLLGDVTSAASVTFSNVAGILSLGTNVDITSGSGPLDFTTITSGVRLNGANGSSNIITANSATGSIKLPAVSATNSSVSLTVSSGTDIDADNINIQSGNLLVTYNTQNQVSTAATLQKVVAGSITVSGNSNSGDRTFLSDSLTIGSGGVTINQFGGLSINASIDSDGSVTTTGISGSQTHLAGNVTSNGGNVTMTGGTLLVDGAATRIIASGGGGVQAGGNIRLGNVDGENGAANLSLDSRGATSGGTVSIGNVTATASGLNRLNIQTNTGQVTLSSTRLVAKSPAAASSLVVSSGGTDIQVDGDIDLRSSNSIAGGVIDFGSSKLTPRTSSSTLALGTSNTSSSGGNGGNIRLGGVANNGVNYFDSVLIDTSAANAIRTDGDLDFNNVASPVIVVDGTSGTGISLVGTIVKAFSGVLSFLTNPNGALANSSSIDVSRADFQSTAGLTFDTSHSAASTNAGNVVLGDIGVLAVYRPNFLLVDTRGSATSGDLLLDDGAGTSTELHVSGDLNLANAKIKVTDNALLRTYGTGNMALGDVATSTAVARNLTLNSEANISVSSVDLTGGTLSVSVDSNDDNVGAAFVSSGALNAGTVSISGSTTRNDNVTIGSNLNTTSSGISFSQINNLNFIGDVTAATNVTFANIDGQLNLESNADVTASNGAIDFTSIASGVQLAGVNGSTNVITANGASGSLTLGGVASSNSTVALTLRSANNVSAGPINIQDGTLDVAFNTLSTAGVNTAAFNEVLAGRLVISGRSAVDDQVTLNGAATIGSGGVLINQYDELAINAALKSTGSITTTGISGSLTHLAANVTTNGGNIAMTGGTLFVDGTANRTISSVGGAVAAGGNITLGRIDGENGVADLTINSKGTATGGTVAIGTVTAGTTGLNRLNIQTDAATPGQVTLSSVRLVAKGSNASTLQVESDGTTILASGTIDLSSNNATDGGSIDFGTSKVAPTTASGTLTLRTSNSSLSGGDGGDIKLGGIANGGLNYFDSVSIDTSASNAIKTNGDLDFSNTASPSIAVDGTSGTGISLIGAIVKAFSGVLSFLTNPNGVSANSSSIDVSKVDFQSTTGLKFDTSGGGASTNAGDVVLGDIGVWAANRPNLLSVDTRGSATNGDLLLDDGAGTSTELHVSGDLNLASANIKITDNAVLRTYGSGSLLLGDLATSTAVARNLTLNSEANVAVSAIDLNGGTLSVNVDSNDDNVGSTFVSTGTLAAGTVSISGSTTENDDVIIGSTMNTTSAGISFSQISKLVFSGDVTAATNATFTNVTGELSLGSNVDVTANNGPLDFSSIASGLRLIGSNGTTSILTAKGTTGSLFLGNVLANNPSVSLTLRSATNTSVGSVDIQNGAFAASIDTDNNNFGATFQSTGALSAGTVTVSGSSTVNDDIIFGSTVTTTTGAIQVIRFDDLRINGDWTSAGGVTTTGISVSRTHLAANIITNGGNISMTDGTLLVDGTSVRQIKSGGAAVDAVNGGSVTLGTIDGQVSTAILEIDSRGTSTSGSVTLGDVTAASGNTGLNRLRIFTVGPTPGQVSLSNIRLIAKSGIAASLGISSGGKAILADGTINLSSSVNGQAGGNVDFGGSVVAPRNANSTLTINTSNTNAVSGADGSNGGDVLLGGIGENSAAATYFDSVTLDLSAADILDSAGTLRFGGVTAPSIQVDGVSGTGIQLVGRVDNAAGGTLSMLTNPSGAIHNTSAIDITQTSFIGSGGLIFDTSGGGSALHSGTISLGDIGLILRPVSLVVDTRGSVSSGHLILNDGVVASPVEIRIDGNIDFSSATVDLFDDASLESHNDGNTISLGATTASGGARNLQLASDSGITVSSINLSGGNLHANVDVNNNEIGATFRSTGAISSNGLAIAGSAANDDIASIGAVITTIGAVSFSNLDQLRIQGAINAGTSLNATNIVGAVDFGGNSSVVANGAIDLQSSVNAIRLSGIAGNTTLIETKGNASLVALSAVTAINPGTRLNVRSDYSADMRNVDMNTGTLDVQIGRSTSLTDASAHLGDVVAGGLIIGGTSTTNDSAVLDGFLDIGTGGIGIQNLANLDVNFDVRSDGDIVASSILNRIQVAEAASILSHRGIDWQTNVGQIQLAGINGLTNLFQADGDSSTLRLASVQALHNVVLLLSSANNINVTSIDAVGSSLSIEVDSNDNTPNSQLNAGQIQAAQISINGGADQNDSAVFAGRVESKSGPLLVSSFGSILLNGDLLSASVLEVSSVSDKLNIGAGRLLKASNGDVNLNNGVNEIRFVGGMGTSSSIQSINGNLFAAAITESSSSDLIGLRADHDVSLLSTNVNSRLQVVAGDHNSNIGTINSNGTLLAGSIAFEAATGIGTNSAVATSTSDLSALNRLGGVLQIANSKTGTVTVSNLLANQGGNILFTQSGGGVVRFQGVTSNPDGTPALNESDIRLSNVGGDLVVEGSGVTAGGLGKVALTTLAAGDTQLMALTRASGGAVEVQSAHRIIGSGTLQGLSVDLNAQSGIGTTGAVQTQTSQLSASSLLNSVDVQNSSTAFTSVSQLRSGGFGTVQFRQVGGGDVAISNVSTGVAFSNVGSNIDLQNGNGAVLIQGTVVAGGGGSIQFDAQKNLVIDAGAFVQTNGVGATIKGNAGGQFHFNPGATIRAGSSDANTEAVVTQIPPVVSVRPKINSLGVNVDSLGVATVQIQLGGVNPTVIDRNFSVVVDWGDNQIDNFPNGSISPLTINPQISRFDASGVIYEITHQYQGNPNLADPIADIPVKVAIGVDALNRIQFTESQVPATSLTQVVNESFVVPAAGLFTLRFDLPQAATLQSRFLFNNSASVATVNAVVPPVSSPEIVISSGGSVAEKSRSYVLRIITLMSEQGGISASEDIELTDDDIKDLSSGDLFLKLGDNRYRIYLIREDGNELLLKDFYLRDHRPVEVDDTAATPISLPPDEPVLDRDFTEIPSLKPETETQINGEPVEIAAEVQEPDKMSNEVKGGEKPINNATIAVGTVVQAMRSWRKAARRFRAG
jgi:hypothetical protein